MTFPPEWGWAKLKAGGRSWFGYYYRDRTAGPSFKCIVELTTPMDDAAIAAAARAASYLGPSTYRLGAHETMGSDGLPEEVWSFLRRDFESGEPAAPHIAKVLRLSPAERTAWGLPAAPPHMEVYL
jgi:hypothetical protein